MTHKVGPKGQVVIPKHLREALGIVPGDDVDFELTERGVLVVPGSSGESLMGSMQGLGLTRLLEEDRRAERR